MKRSLAVFLAVASLACAAGDLSPSGSGATAPASDDWMPLHPGIRWVYHAERKNWVRLKGTKTIPHGKADSSVDEIRVEGIDATPGGGWAWRVFFGDGAGYDQLRASSGTTWVMERVGPSAVEIGRILDHHESGLTGFQAHPALLWVRRDAAPGMKWTYTFYRTNRPVKLNVEVVGFEDVSTPAGNFPGCLKIRMSGAWYDAGMTPGAGRPMALEVEEWWARGVGKVKHVQRLGSTDSLGDGTYAGMFIESTMVLRDWYDVRPERHVFPVRAVRPWQKQRAELAGLLKQGRYDALEAKLGALEAAQQRGEITTSELSDLYGLFDGAERADLDRWVEASPTSYMAHAARGIYLAERSWELIQSEDDAEERIRVLVEAGQDLGAALKIRDDHAPSLRALFNVAMWVGDHRTGAAVFARRREIETDPVDAYRELIYFLSPQHGGSAEVLLQMADEARAHHGPGEVADRVRGQVLGHVAMLYEKQDPARATAIFAKAAPLSPTARRWWSEFQRDAGHFREAVANLDRLMAAAPASSEWLLDRAEIYQRLGYPEYAFADLDLALSGNPEDAALHAKRAKYAQDAGRFDESVASWDRAVELAPTNYNYWKGRGDLFDDLQQPRRAADSYQHAVELTPGNAWYEFFYARALYNAGDVRATKELQRYLEISKGYRGQWGMRIDAERMLHSQAASPDPAAR